MKLHCTLTTEMYKYMYGNFNSWEVPFREREAIELVCAQNDSVATQVLVYSNEDTMISIDKYPAFHEKYPIKTIRVETILESIEDCEVEVQFVELVRDDDGNYKSEALLSQQRKFNEKLKVQPIWIEVKTGKNTKPGKYQGKLRIYYSELLEDEVFHKELTFEVEVLPVALKSLNEGNFYLDLWQHNTSIARTYDVKLWSDDHFRLIENYIKVLAELGQKAISVIVSEIPWSGQWSAYYRTNPSDYFEYSMVEVRLDKDGNWQYDFTAMNRYINLCLDYNISKEIEIFGLLGVWTMPDAGYGKVLEDSQEAARVRYLDEQAGTFKYIRKKEDLEKYIKAINQNICDNNWQEKAKIICDEPLDVKKFKETLSELSQMIPDIKFKVSLFSADFVLEDIDGIDDYVINLPIVLEQNKRVKDIKEEKQVDMSFYVAIDPKHPNTFFRCHLAESRFLPWLSMYMNMDGFLRWAIWLWPNNAFDFESYHYQKFAAGGTHFVYPGKSGKPIYSLRYKNLKKGIRDYLIFERYIEQTGNKQEVMDAIQSIMKVNSLEYMHQKYRKNVDEIMSLDYYEYENVVNSFLRKL